MSKRDFLFPQDPVSLARYEARRTVRRLRGFYFHLGIFLLALVASWSYFAVSASAKSVPIRPFFFWGLGLGIHFLTVFGRSHFLGAAWEERKIQEILAKQKIQELSQEKQSVQAQLRLLQAQIEPHFLFNTLANVTSLIEPAPAKARAMLENFIAYLRGSLAASRNTRGSLAQEIELLRRYLDILQIRMGERLRFELDVSPELLTEPLAAMLLQPVVENAVRHGLEPKVEGGKVRVEARAITEQMPGGRMPTRQMQIVIEDNGLGFQPGANAGVGLDNLRERLNVLYEGQAKLSIEDAKPGTRVRLALPRAAFSPSATSLPSAT